MARNPDPSPAPNQGIAMWGWNGTEWEVVLLDPGGNIKSDPIQLRLLEDIVMLLRDIKNRLEGMR